MIARRLTVPADRRFVSIWAVVTSVAVIVAVVAGVLAWRGTSVDDAAAPIRQAAAIAVTDLMNFSPDDDAADRARVAERLTGALAADYLTRGPDVVFPAATTSRVEMAAVVLDVGVTERTGSRARVLVFVDQSIALQGAPGEPERIGVARWATMTAENGRWLLARLEPVSPQ
ncbi:hypothetical protein MUG78_02895 [Gordonia alkaliphila]|uniref:hypothetical protein n=1 Tax=Gordonia alkaliphila TaxID=1053547 RepID=UPI001FF32EBD|nr:hypothetical protein [Gordonia alkaliphila]MCK0438436.1 hypothetical protein [Gordonia alkaliphila]